MIDKGNIFDEFDKDFILLETTDDLSRICLHRITNQLAYLCRDVRDNKNIKNSNTNEKDAIAKELDRDIKILTKIRVPSFSSKRGIERCEMIKKEYIDIGRHYSSEKFSFYYNKFDMFPLPYYVSLANNIIINKKSFSDEDITILNNIYEVLVEFRSDLD